MTNAKATVCHGIFRLKNVTDPMVRTHGDPDLGQKKGAEDNLGLQVVTDAPQTLSSFQFIFPAGSMYAIYGNIYHQYTPNVSIYTIHGSYGF